MNIQVVIGANYGDEGKGKITNHLCKQHQSNKSLVVCFNGGSQRGHTVGHNGISHVFHHFGSGTLYGCDTYLSQYFICNPILFKKEFDQLKYIINSSMPYIYINQDCLVTTPYDMLYNQLIETNRGRERHGSCGTGIFETIQRSIDIPLFYKRSNINVDKLKQIRKYYLDKIDSQSIREDIYNDFIVHFNNDNIMYQFILDCKFMFDNSFIFKEKDLFNYDNLIFEGGQGLRLDMNNIVEFPHLTPSNTGLKNVIRILEQFDLLNDNININYVTRTYLTRHGAGNFIEQQIPDDWEIIDYTNVDNQFQGSIKYGFININELVEYISKDLLYINRYDNLSLFVNCLDQTPNLHYFYNNKMYITDFNQFEKFIKELINIKVTIVKK